MLGFMRCVGLASEVTVAAAIARGVEGNGHRSSTSTVRMNLKGGRTLKFNRATKNEQDSAGNTELHKAILQGDGELAYALIMEMDVNTSIENSDRKTSLVLATELTSDSPHWDRWSTNMGQLVTHGLQKQAASLSLDLASYFTNAKDAINEAFMLAVKRGQLDLARYYWINGADPNESKYTGSVKRLGGPQYSPLQWLIQGSDRVLPFNMQKFNHPPS